LEIAMAEEIKLAAEISSILKDVVIVSVALYTAWWTYRSFAYKDQINETKELLESVERIRQEAFFNLSIETVDGERKNDYGDILNLVFDMRVKFNSSLYINGEVLQKFVELDNFISSEVLFKVNKDTYMEIQNRFNDKYSNLRTCILESTKHHK
jgi:hypothetical protein